MKKAEKAYLDKVAQIPCVLCAYIGRRTWPVQLHHLRDGVGMSQRASHYLVIPLCPDCHQGPCGIHGDRTYLRIQKITEMDLLADTIQEAVR